jgi:hypothetical protein
MARQSPSVAIYVAIDVRVVAGLLRDRSIFHAVQVVDSRVVDRTCGWVIDRGAHIKCDHEVAMVVAHHLRLDGLRARTLGQPFEVRHKRNDIVHRIAKLPDTMLLMGLMHLHPHACHHTIGTHASQRLVKQRAPFSDRLHLTRGQHNLDLRDVVRQKPFAKRCVANPTRKRLTDWCVANGVSG